MANQWQLLQVAAFNLFLVVISNVLSSTMCAIICYPVIVRVGVTLGHPKLVGMTCCILTSGAMGLPVSSFPNAIQTPQPAPV